MVPPKILFKGKRLKFEWKDNLNPNTKLIKTTKRSITANVFIQCFFFQFKSVIGKIILIFYGTSSYLNINIVSAANKHNIT